jgi:dihydroorotate dehydrogenase (fumarate)
MFCEFDPPLLNSANVWATTKDDLKALYWSNFTGGITTRTTLIDGFSHDDKIHQHCFFDPNSSDVLHESVDTQSSKSSLNTLGYSPLPLTEYIEIVCEIENEFTRSTKGRKFKPVIFSVTGTASQICECYAELCHARMNGTGPWLMEINLSCPNIVDKPPPAYSQQALSLHLKLLQDIQSIDDPKSIPVGIKVPPYTYQGQFDNLINALL